MKVIRLLFFLTNDCNSVLSIVITYNIAEFLQLLDGQRGCTTITKTSRGTCPLDAVTNCRTIPTSRMAKAMPVKRRSHGGSVVSNYTDIS